MNYIDFESIHNLNISPAQCLEWANNALLLKETAILPPKISIKFNEGCFYNTMPVLINKINKFGVKVVSRYPNAAPSLSADIMLYDLLTGEMLAVMDGTWITAMRTGAVAAISINLLKVKDSNTFSFIGLGNTARATLLCLSEILKNKDITVKILAYKDQHKNFIQRFSSFKNITFKVFNDVSNMIKESDTIISCVTVTKNNFAVDSDYKEGVLAVPVHTMGFQNCDLFFDKIFCDDIGHIKDFKNFSNFKHCDEVSNILTGKNPGRTSEKERILAYNIGIAIHDIYFAANIYDMLKEKNNKTNNYKPPKFWV